jgi:hypothetical protein
VYVDRIIYKDRIVEKEILEEVQVEVELERVQYVNQMVEKEVKKIIEVPVETFRYEDRITKKIVEKVVTEERPVPGKGVKEVPKVSEREKKKEGRLESMEYCS